MRSSSWFWRLLSKFQNNKDNSAYFCGLLRKAEFYRHIFQIYLLVSDSQSRLCSLRSHWWFEVGYWHWWLFHKGSGKKIESKNVLFWLKNKQVVGGYFCLTIVQLFSEKKEYFLDFRACFFKGENCFFFYCKIEIN